MTEYTGRSLSRQTHKMSALLGLTKMADEDIVGALKLVGGFRSDRYGPRRGSRSAK